MHKTKTITQNLNDNQISNKITTTPAKVKRNIQKTRLNQKHDEGQNPGGAHYSSTKTNNKKTNHLGPKYQTNYTCVALAVLFTTALAASSTYPPWFITSIPMNRIYAVLLL